MSGDQLFDTIGATYATTRPADPRIAARIWAALGDARPRWQAPHRLIGGVARVA